jgi:hypothetical protein
LEGRPVLADARQARVAPALLEAGYVLLAEAGKSASCSWVRPFSCLVRLTFRPAGLRMSMR